MCLKIELKLCLITLIFVKYVDIQSLNIDAWRISVKIRVTDMQAMHRTYENVLNDFIIYLIFYFIFIFL